MRRFRIPIGRVLGVRLSLHASWFLVLGLVLWATVAAFDSLYPGLGQSAHVAMGLVTALAFFACLTAHELAHAMVARRFGIRVRGITLFAFGGVAEIDGEVPTPAREFAVALVGPATSLAIGGLLALGSVGAKNLRWPAGEGVLATLALVNLGIAVFNLVPGLPLDGGRLLRAGLWRLTGSYPRATRVASAGGKVLAACLAAFGAVVAATGDPIGLWYVPMAAFLWLLAGRPGRLGGPGARAAVGGGEPIADHDATREASTKALHVETFGGGS